MIVFMTHQVTHTTVCHQHFDTLKNFPYVTIEFLIVLLCLFKSTEQVELGSLLGVVVLPDFQGSLYQWTVFPVVEGKDKVAMIFCLREHLCHLLTMRALGQHSLVKPLTELERSACVNQLLQTSTPNGRVGCKEVVIPQIDVGTHQPTILISFFIKEPFKVGIGEDFVFQLIDAERTMADAATC